MTEEKTQTQNGVKGGYETYLAVDGERLAEEMIDPLLVLDAGGHCLFANAAAERLMGKTRAELDGGVFWDIISPLGGGSFQRHFQRALERRETVAFEQHLPEQGVWLEVRLWPFGPGIAAQYRDITRCVRAEAALQVAEGRVAHSLRRQRAFVREMLAAVTEGRLRLCDSESDLPEPLTALSPPVPLAHAHANRTLRRHAAAACAAAGIPYRRRIDFTTAVAEAAMNAATHGGGGIGRVYANAAAKNCPVQVWIRDEGAGIAEELLHRAMLERGYSSAGTLGHGFFLMQQTADRVYVLTGPQGTTVVLEMWRDPPEPNWMQHAGRAREMLGD